MRGREEVRLALEEDRANEDVTTRLLGSRTKSPAVARFVAEGRFVVAGMPVVETVFHELDPSAQLRNAIPEGTWCEPGGTLVTAHASAATLLAGERVALNFLQRLCGIATVTRHCVDAVAGTGAAITHTRKTTPGLRELERYAVRMGGGIENRGSLAEAVLWKDNHWELLGSSQRKLQDVLAAAPAGLEVIVEVESDQQLEEALAAGVMHLLVDNQTPERLAQWVRRAGANVTVQASGGITVETVRTYAGAGAKLISIGMLTHSAPAAPIGCEIRLTD